MKNDLSTISTIHQELDELELMVSLATLQAMQMEQDIEFLRAENAALRQTVDQLSPKSTLH